MTLKFLAEYWKLLNKNSEYPNTEKIKLFILKPNGLNSRLDTTEEKKSDQKYSLEEKILKQMSKWKTEKKREKKRMQSTNQR